MPGALAQTIPDFSSQNRSVALVLAAPE